MPVSLNSWHRIKVSRTGLQGVLEVDDQIPVQGLSKGAYTQLTLLQPLFVGGHPDFDITSRQLNQSSSYQGCVQKVVGCIFIGMYNSYLVIIFITNQARTCRTVMYMVYVSQELPDVFLLLS